MGGSVRLRFPELFDELGLTALEVARKTQGRINQSTVYKWQKFRGRMKYVDAEAIEDLCEFLGLELTDVVELERPRRRR